MKFSARKQNKEINLLPKSGFASTTSGRILTWLLSTFRVIVIITEILVMVAFLSRFWLDAQNSDLNDQLTQKKNLLTASLDFEEDLFDTQRRIEIYEDYTIDSGDYSETLGYITNSLPPDVILNSVTLNKGDVQISGITPNEIGIQQLITNLLVNEKFVDVSIEQLSTGRDLSEILTFSLLANKTK